MKIPSLSGKKTHPCSSKESLSLALHIALRVSWQSVTAVVCSSNYFIKTLLLIGILSTQSSRSVWYCSVRNLSSLSQATSMAWRMARSTRLGVVWKVFATWGVQYLGDGIDDIHIVHRNDDGLSQILVALDVSGDADDVHYAVYGVNALVFIPAWMFSRFIHFLLVFF